MSRERGDFEWWGPFVRSRRGALAVNFALLLAPLCVIAVGAIDLTSVLNDRQTMQHVADATALDAAAQMVLADTSGVAARADALARSQLARIADRVDFTTETAVDPKTASVTLTIDGHRASFFGNLLPPGGWHLKVSATAMSMGRTPLCVLHSSDKGQFAMDDGARLTAPGCLVHSDGDIAVKKSAALRADVVQAVGTATGAITPAALTDAAPITDPFASLQIDIPRKVLLCQPLDLLTEFGVTTLAAGVHCGNITVAKNATMRLAPGTHYFAKGKLTVQEGATLTVANPTKGATLVFDRDADLTFKDNAVIDLVGSASGQYAGFVILTTRANAHTFDISSDNARKLLGTIYIPNATLAISGTGNKVAQQSAWTVIVAKAILMTGTPNLVINSNYAGASVPVPSGVGRNRGVALTR